jgi:anaerobic magnesium-protoporphyrin IX monomethyl ester cyclase
MGLALIAAILEREGYPVTILDTNALKLEPEEVAPLVSDADVICLTAMTPTINNAIAIAHHLKKTCPDLTIILGGAHATLLPEETLATAPEIDVLVRGEGETTIIELLRALEDRKPLGNIAGISYRQDGEVINNPVRPQNTDLDSLPFLGYHQLNLRHYQPHPPHGRAHPFAALITSRGCPYHCSYCSKPIFGSTFRAQSPQRVVDEVVHLISRFGVKEIAFYDDVFTLDKKRAHAIADELIKRRVRIPWACETRVNLVDGAILSHLKQAGCYSIAYGIESGSQEILDTLNKNVTLAQAAEAVSMTRKVGIQAIGYFMIGTPGETPQTIAQTINFARKLKLDFAQFAITTPYPGTELYDLYLERGGGKVPWQNFVYEVTSSKISRLIPVFESQELKRTDLQAWIARAYKEFYLRPAYLWQRIRQLKSFGDLKVNVKGLFALLPGTRKAG